MDTLGMLRAAIEGTVIEPADPGYDEARAIWNGMIDRHPAAIVRAGGVGDIARTIAAAQSSGCRWRSAAAVTTSQGMAPWMAASCSISAG